LTDWTSEGHNKNISAKRWCVSSLELDLHSNPVSNWHHSDQGRIQGSGLWINPLPPLFGGNFFFNFLGFLRKKSKNPSKFSRPYKEILTLGTVRNVFLRILTVKMIQGS